MRKESLLIHGDTAKHDQYNSLKPAVYDSAAFEFNSSEEIEAAFTGKTKEFTYSRSGNPTVRELEERLTMIADASATVCFSSGMAAIANSILMICKPGDNIISSKYLFGNTYAFFKNSLQRLGVECRFVDVCDIKSIEQSIDSNTRIFFAESISNPLLVIPDFYKVSELCKNHKIILMIDNTLPTPLFFKSKDLGIDIEIMSTTKSISGGATSVGGALLVYNSSTWQASKYNTTDISAELNFVKQLRREIFRDFGACLSPHNAYLQLLGLETLSLRLDKMGANALALALFMCSNAAFTNVNYVGLSSNKFNKEHVVYLNGFGTNLISFEMKDRQTCFAFMNKLKMIRRATNLCDNKSLIIHPNSTIYSEFSQEEKDFQGINDCQIRFSVGIEHIEDLKEDIINALK